MCVDSRPTGSPAKSLNKNQNNNNPALYVTQSDINVVLNKVHHVKLNMKWGFNGQALPLPNVNIGHPKYDIETPLSAKRFTDL